MYRRCKRSGYHLCRERCRRPQRSFPTLPRDVASKTTSGTRPIIRVKKEIQERQTGLECDKHSSYVKLRQRQTFKQLSLTCLKLDMEGKTPVSIVEDKSVDDALRNLSQAMDQNSDSASPVEDKPMLRERTRKLFDLLADTESRSIAVISHKGYLRELERGPLGYEDAELFKNCEVRVYRLQLDISADVHGSVDKMIECDGIVKVNDHKDGPDRMLQQRSSSVSSSGNAVLQRAEKLVSSISSIFK